MKISPALVGVVLALRTVNAGAQIVRGTVTLPDGAPAAGAIVEASRAGSGEAARALTSGTGAYLLRLPAAGRFEIRVLRVGFHPTAVPALDVAIGETKEQAIVLRNDPVVLAAVDVKENGRCRVNPDSGLAVAQLWKEARSALAISQLSSTGAPLVAEWIDYDRTLDATARLVRKLSVRISRNPTTHAFRSLPPDILAAKGFTTDNSAGRIFYAPDAAVLLSESFAATHCFRLAAPSPERSGLVGVGFEPTRVRDDVRDIAGTFWVDPGTAELRALDFRYTNLEDPTQAAGAGGSVEFLRIADGEWLVNRWNVRVPQVGASGQLMPTGIERTFSATRSVVRSVQVTGGEVTRVTRRDSVLYRASGDTLAVQLIARDTLVKAAGATLTLAGTDYTATADASGRIVLSPVLEGEYLARAGSALMDSLGVDDVEHEVEVGSRTHVDSIALPGAHDVLRKVCPSDSLRHGEGMLRGTVRDAHGRAMRQAAVSVTWQGDFSKVGGALGWSERTLGALTDDSGRWRLCGVARDQALTVRVESDSGSDARTTTIGLDRPFGTVDLVARGGASASAAPRAGERALVELAVYGAAGTPLSDATLEVSGANDATRTIVTGSGGRALLPDVAPGILRVRVKHIGYKPGQVAATVEAGRNTVPIYLSAAALPTIDTVRVVGGQRTLDPREGFETRRLQGLGTFVTEEELAKHPSSVLADVLARIKGIRLEYGVRVGPGTSGVSMPYMFGTSRGYCIPNIFLDGKLFMMVKSDPTFSDAAPTVQQNEDVVSQYSDLSLAVSPERITGIEVYTTSGVIPAQYDLTSSTGCGSIVIWTRR